MYCEHSLARVEDEKEQTLRYMDRKQRLYMMYLGVLGLTIFLSLFLVISLFANWPAVKNELEFVFARPTQIEVAASPTPQAATPTPIIEPAHIVIEKLGVDAPIQWDIPAEQTIDALNTGVAHLAGTAKLGQIGNLFITGHSSDYVWKQNPYAAVFSLLPKLEIGDTFVLRENGQTYTYKVIQTKIVNPDQVDVANATQTPIATLMTCYPIGTTQQRFIVHASLVSGPGNLAQTGVQPDSQTLPEIKFR